MTLQANLENVVEYTTIVAVIVPDIISSSFLKSAKAANGNPQFATGPQKCVEKKYSLADGDFAQLANLLNVDILSASTC